MCKMRYPTQDTSDELKMRFPGWKIGRILWELKLPDKRLATVWRIIRRKPGVSWEMENEIRASLDMEPLPQEVDTYDPRTHRIVKNAQPRTRKPRKSRGFDADLIILFDMERDRRGLTNSEYLAALMGVSST